MQQPEEDEEEWAKSSLGGRGRAKRSGVRRLHCYTTTDIHLHLGWLPEVSLSQ